MERKGGDVLLQAVKSGAVIFNEGGMGGSAREGFDADGAATGKEVEEVGLLNAILADIKESAADELGGRACRFAFWGADALATKCTGEDFN